MRESLDQKRARFAWEKVRNMTDEYAKLAKGAPALIMQSGLMPVLAFYQNKGRRSDHHSNLLKHIIEWLQKQFPNKISNLEFNTVMTALMGQAGGDAAAHARFYQHATEETLALLRWIRLFAAAVCEKEGGKDGSNA